MSTSHNRQGVLVEVKAASARRLMESHIELAGIAFAWEEVFRGPLSIDALATTEETTWVLAQASAEAPDLSGWDWVHLLGRQLPADLVAEGAVLRLEPNIVPVPQHVARPRTDADELESWLDPQASRDCRPDPQDPAWPVGPGIAWHLGDAFSQLSRARARFDPGPKRVRIGHLDTGYSPDHVTCPRHIRRELGFNFWRENTDTKDDLGGIFQGHGTRTLSVLAGNRVRVPGFDADLGGAPDAEVVPIVADGGVLISNHNLALWLRAVEHAMLRECDVLSISAGGIWVDGGAFERVLQEAESRGMVVVAAAGNHFCGPTAMVWPARYDTVVAVTGAMADQKPYHYPCSLRYYSSSYGPTAAMGTAIAGYSPNITAARYGCPAVLSYNADGTSHATPQVAAAAALWVQMHGRRYSGSARAQACRRALFAAAETRSSDAWMFGNGILRANAALDVIPAAAELEAETAEIATADAPLAKLAGLSEQPALVRSMLLGEMTDLLHRSQATQEPGATAASEPLERQIAQAFERQRGSVALRRFLTAGAALEAVAAR